MERHPEPGGFVLACVENSVPGRRAGDGPGKGEGDGPAFLWSLFISVAGRGGSAAGRGVKTNASDRESTA
ncbi:hypothetical protein GCM10023085_00010 [Actinomadura viridis]